MSTADPLGYYRVLGLASTASSAEIKAAFRHKAMEYHPDRCNAPNATILFQQVNTAYSVLGAPESRARYDTSTVETSDTARSTSSRQAPPSPIVCSRCGKVSAQPRYAIFYRVMSFVFVTRREPIQGVFCSACAEREALKATGISWLLGWWGFPWGPIYTVHSLFVNMFGGRRPVDINARLLAHQAWYFAAVGQMEVARAVAEQALALALRIKPANDHAATQLRAQLDAFIASFPAGARVQQLKDSWARFRRLFFLQLAPVVATMGLLGYFWSQPAAPDFSSYSKPVAEGKPYTPTPPPESVQSSEFATPPATTQTNGLTVAQALSRPVAANSAPSIFDHLGAAATVTVAKPPYIRPALAPNGRLWPTVGSYIKGLPQLNRNGYSQVTVDNSRNRTDVFVKLTSVSGPKAYPVRQFFIPAYGSFVVFKLRAGAYDVRYMDLDSGIKMGTPSFSLTETRVEGGVEYSRYELTLYTVADGNMEMRPLSDAEF